jgi:hypothetical protein
VSDYAPRFMCDHCGWTGGVGDQVVHPREGDGVRPWCWAEGFETRPRKLMGPLIEAVLGPELEKAPRTPKALIDMTDEEWDVAIRTEGARAAHERADVRLESGIEGKDQLGFGFMREEFRVAPAQQKPRGYTPRGRS